MSDTGMTQEQLLMWLIANAAGSPSGMKSMMSNIENPIYAAMVGGYDPLSQMQSGGGQLWNTYSQTQDPDMQTIVQMIDSGADEYAIQSAVDRMYAGESFAAKAGREPFESLGMSADAIRSLIRDMQKERSLGSSVSDVFAAAGFSNPTEQYTTETVPLVGQAAAEAAMLRGQSDELMKLYAKRMKETKAEQAKTGELKEKVKKQETKREPSIIEMLIPGSYGASASIQREMSNPKANPEDVAALKQQRTASRKATRESQKARIDMLKAQMEDQAFREGYVRGIQSQGRTPFLDQAQARLAMMQLLK